MPSLVELLYYAQHCRFMSPWTTTSSDFGGRHTIRFRECDQCAISQKSTAVPTLVSVQLINALISHTHDSLNTTYFAADATTWDCLEVGAVSQALSAKLLQR